MTFQVLAAIALAIALGVYFPHAGQAMKPIADIFINLIKMVVAPIIFCTIAAGISSMGSLKKAGRIGFKALIYFEVVTTFALLAGLLVANLVRPGDHVNLAAISGGSIASYAAEAKAFSWMEFFMHIIPANIVDAFAKGDVLQIIFFSICFGVGVAKIGSAGESITLLLDKLLQVCFAILAMVMRLAPLGAFGGMAYTIGKFGFGTLAPLAKLMLSVYLTMILFIFVVLNLIARFYGFSLFKLLAYIREEIVIVIGTSSSESVLPRMLARMEEFGCSKSVVGLVIPAGYSFNLDGTTIYLSMAALFLAQVFNVNLSLSHQLGLIGILMVTSKGAAAITGGGFIVLASTLSVLNIVPVEGLALLLGVDRFMSEARALTNLIGNAVATVVIAKSENEFNPPPKSHERLCGRLPG